MPYTFRCSVIIIIIYQLNGVAIHKITPVHKSGDKACVENYRPISLLCVTSKVLEHLIFEQCYDYFADIFSDKQFGFLKRRSSLQQLLLFYNEIFDSVSSDCQSDVIFLDYAKAFDSVPHKELLLKLRRLGVGGDMWLWLNEYLTNRMQCVSIEGTCSEVLPVMSGVPQGSMIYLPW